MITYVTYALSKMIFCTEVSEILLQYRFSRQGVLFYIEENISRTPGTKIMCSIMSVKPTLWNTKYHVCSIRSRKYLMRINEYLA